MNPVAAYLGASLRLPVAKALMAVGLAVAGGALACTLTEPVRWPGMLVLAAGLAWASMVDIDRMLLPNVLTLGLLAAGLVEAMLLQPELLPGRMVAAGLGYGLIVAVNAGFRRLRGKDGIGHGDAKLLGAAGAWAGLAAIPLVLLLGSTVTLVGLAAMMAQRKAGPGALGLALPFGPGLALGAFVVALFRDALPLA